MCIEGLLDPMYETLERTSPCSIKLQKPVYILSLEFNP